MALLIVAPAAADPPDDTDDPAIAAEDQGLPDSDETVSNPLAPRAMSPNGPAANGTYTTELWEAEDSATDDGVNVVASTDAGTYALTGLVVDEETQSPLVGAVVSVKTTVNDPCPLCERPLGDYPIVTNTTTITDGGGSFAFVNMATAQKYPLLKGYPTGWQVQVDISVSATGHGTFRHLEYNTSADESYLKSVELGAADETRLGAVAVSADRSALPAALPDLGGYISRRHPPPTIKVAEFQQDSECKTVGSSYRVRTYPWRYYVLTTLAKEAGGNWRDGGWFDEQSAKAVGLSVHQFAWHFAILKGGGLSHGGADVDNTVNSFQCLDHSIDLPLSRYKLFKRWYDDVIDERVVDANGAIPILQHASGIYRCTEPADSYFAAGKNRVSQFGAKAQEETCGKSYAGAWRDIVRYYLSTDRSIASVAKPPTPHTAYAAVTGEGGNAGTVTLSFSSRVTNSSGRKSEVAFQYYILRKLDGGTWTRVRTIRFSRQQQKVPTSATFRLSGCASFRIAASNPAGLSLYDAVSNNPAATGPDRICV